MCASRLKLVGDSSRAQLHGSSLHGASRARHRAVQDTRSTVAPGGHKWSGTPWGGTESLSGGGGGVRSPPNATARAHVGGEGLEGRGGLCARGVTGHRGRWRAYQRNKNPLLHLGPVRGHSPPQMCPGSFPGVWGGNGPGLLSGLLLRCRANVSQPRQREAGGLQGPWSRAQACPGDSSGTPGGRCAGLHDAVGCVRGGSAARPVLFGDSLALSGPSPPSAHDSRAGRGLRGGLWSGDKELPWLRPWAAERRQLGLGDGLPTSWATHFPSFRPLTPRLCFQSVQLVQL